MGSIKQLLMDSFNGFSPADVPLFLFQLIVAGLMGFLIQWCFNRKLVADQKLAQGILIAIMVSVLVAISKIYLPFAIIAAALVLLLGNSIKKDSLTANLGVITLLITGAGCGFGSVVQTILGVFILLILVLLVPTEKRA